MLVMIDNRDSFTFNLTDMLASGGADVRVVRSDEATLADVAALNPTRIVISPGPGHPADAPLALQIAGGILPGVPVLGVCLGMQCMVAAAGGDIVRLDDRVHGQSSAISHDDNGIFAGMEQDFAAARYHSLVACPQSLPADLAVTARTADGLIMGVRHRTLPLEGVQFHPESILTPAGAMLLQRFVTEPYRPTTPRPTRLTKQAA